MSNFYLTSALPTLFTTLRTLSFDSRSKSNVIFKVSGTITWSLEPCGISVSMCCLGYLMFGMLVLTMFSLLPLKANCILFINCIVSINCSCLYVICIYHDILWPVIKHLYILLKIIPAVHQRLYNHGVKHWRFSIKHLYCPYVVSSTTSMKGA